MRDDFVKMMERERRIKEEKLRSDINATPSMNINEVNKLRDFNLRSEEEKSPFMIHKKMLED